MATIKFTTEFSWGGKKKTEKKTSVKGKKYTQKSIKKTGWSGDSVLIHRLTAI